MMTMDQLISLSPLVVGVIAWLITSPGREENRIGRLRKKLLDDLRLRVSKQIAEKLPEKKKGISADDYWAQTQESIKEYIALNQKEFLDFSTSESRYRKFVTTVRFFKYSIFLSALILGGFFLILFGFEQKIPANIVAIGKIVVGGILLFVIIGFATCLERAKDKFQDLCSDYEIADNDE